MTQDEIEHMWKVASNNPNHDTNWHDPVVIAFAKLVEEKVRQELREEIVYTWVPPHFVDLAVKEEREACALIGDNYHDEEANCGDLIRARGNK